MSALAERMFAHSAHPRNADAYPRPRDAETPARPELEQADLAGLQRRLARLNPDPRLAAILTDMSKL